MIDNTQKHYEPRFYLKGFSPLDAYGKVWAFDKRSPDNGAHLVSIGNIGKSRDAYSITANAELTRLEQEFADCLKTIIPAVELDGDFPIKAHPEMLELMSNFLMVSRSRSSGMRGLLREAYGRAMTPSNFVDMLNSSLSRHYGATLDKRSEDSFLAKASARDMFNARRFVAQLDPTSHGDRTDEMRAEIKNGKWRFYRNAPGRSYITSDFQAWWAPIASGEFAGSASWDMALSSRVRVKVMCGPWSGRIYDTWPLYSLRDDEQTVDNMNASNYAVSYQWVYAASRDELLHAVRQSHPPLLEQP